MKYYKIVAKTNGAVYAYSTNILQADSMLINYNNVILYEIDSDTNVYRIVKEK